MTQSAPVVHILPATFCASLELSASRWKLGFTLGDRVHAVTIEPRDLKRFASEVIRFRRKFGLADEVPLHTCYEAGRDGFWIHRRLSEMGVANVVVDPSSIQVNRRARRAKTDQLDVVSLAMLLVRHVRGERGVWQVVHVPSEEVEDARRLHRERERLIKEKTMHLTRIRALLSLRGLSVQGMTQLPRLLSRLPEHLRAELEREHERLKLVMTQLGALDEARNAAITEGSLPSADKIRDLQQLKGIGATTAAVLVGEFFGWRGFKSGKQVGSCAGLTPTPYASGDIDREQGISKAGSRRLRTMSIELAWLWIRYQPDSALSAWFAKRFAKGSGRSRRLGIVAVARKLLVALWRYLEHGVIPDGALMKS